MRFLAFIILAISICWSIDIVNTMQKDSSFTDKLTPPVIVVMSIKNGTIFMVKYGKNSDSVAECPKSMSHKYILKYKVGDTIIK